MSVSYPGVTLLPKCHSQCYSCVTTLFPCHNAIQFTLLPKCHIQCYSYVASQVWLPRPCVTMLLKCHSQCCPSITYNAISVSLCYPSVTFNAVQVSLTMLSICHNANQVSLTMLFMCHIATQVAQTKVFKCHKQSILSKCHIKCYWSCTHTHSDIQTSQYWNTACKLLSSMLCDRLQLITSVKNSLHLNVNRSRPIKFPLKSIPLNSLMANLIYLTSMVLQKAQV